MNALRSRADVAAAALLALLSLGLWLPRLTGPLDLRYDAGVYYVLGTALAEGAGYRLLNEPGAIQAVQYPPLLPLLVALHERITGSTDPNVAGHALRWTFAVLFFVYVQFVYRLGRRWLDPGWALVATALVVLHLQLVWLSDLLFAELPFALCAVLFVLVAEPRAHRAASWLFATAAYLLRSTGLAALAVWVADAVVHRRSFEAASRAVLAVLPVLCWQLYVGSVQRSPEYHEPAYVYQRAPYQYYNVGYAENMAYLDPFTPERGLASAAQLARRALDNVLGLPAALGESVSGDARWIRGVLERVPHAPRVPSWLVASPFAMLGLTSAMGQVLLAIRGARVGPLYWVASLVLMALTPWPAQFNRYLMPLAPLTALGLTTAVASLTATWPGRAVRRTVTGGIATVLLFQTLVLGVVFGRQHTPSVDGGQNLFFHDGAWRAHDTAIAWLARNAPHGAVVATSTPHRIYLATGLPSVFPPFEPDVATAARLLDAVPVEYVIVDDLGFVDVTRRYALPVMAAFTDRWTLVYGKATEGSRIYRRTGRS